MKIEVWNRFQIRFVEIEGEWYGIAKDISEALGYRDANSMVKKLSNRHFVYAKMADMNQKYLALTEFGIYKAIFNSKKPEAEEFQEWVFEVIKKLRTQIGLEGFEVFRMIDKQHQKHAMSEIKKSFANVSQKDYIKANMIANKAVSNEFGYPKLVKKGNMSPDMLKRRQPILEDTVILMSAKEKFDLPISVSEEVYKKVEEQ